MHTLNFWEIIERISRLHSLHQHQVEVFIEAPNLNKWVWEGKKGVSLDAPAALKVARNIGMNQYAAVLMGQYCLRHGIPHRMVRPHKGSHTKLKAKEFRQITGYRKRTSYHGRDAAMLVYGRG